MGSINFFQEDCEYAPASPEALIQWLHQIAADHQYLIEDLNYIFCSDEYLLGVNRQFLDHDYYTDIITFDNSLEAGQIISDIFISIDRVKDNAQDLGISEQSELHRVMAHGLLHLLGYQDKTDDQKIIMRQKEDTCLSLLKI
ncbi:rRNA maturation RNase YbeY [Marinoscillum furvescens]|uniref:Endoribonuclease YbeY n=1 Tax=Marinoscillum furvescens DSM 4134 TaxID=1122208 RepID=A0A3D9KZ51_MARFU|nr:rRNA maturation RNase YbeY [Marinoscillum furvescens]RED94135.1 rRNA maturation RNase YbeY [Marinoscillum furvescens DSM 4134]